MDRVNDIASQTDYPSHGSGPWWATRVLWVRYCAPFFPGCSFAGRTRALVVMGTLRGAL